MSIPSVSLAVATIELNLIRSLSAGLTANRAKDTAIRDGLKFAPRPEINVEAAPKAKPQVNNIVSQPIIIQPAYRLEVAATPETSSARTHLPPANFSTYAPTTTTATAPTTPAISSPWSKLPTVDQASQDTAKHPVKVVVQQVDIVTKGMLLDLFI